MLRILLCAIVVLACPGPAAAGARVSAFFYPWYSTAARDGAYVHWSQTGHVPPNDIASSFYPARGLYSSSDRLVLGQQMDEIARAGIDEIAVSWWGTGSPEDARLPAVVAAARAHRLAVAAHLEPYPGRTAATTATDIRYLRGLGIRTFYVYRPLDLPAADWAAMNATLTGVEVLAQTGLVGAALQGGFDGVYTYDVVTFGGDKFTRICSAAHAHGLLCAPSVGPGYDARRGSLDPRVKPRRDGATYDAMWRAAIAARADRVTITSYNEWHEGTQIEPAAPAGRHGAYRYLSYDGAWGRRDPDAGRAYLDRTAYWSRVFRATRQSSSSSKAP
jgi:glycoprotein endo-alpha-1,2-mannosidase